MQIPEKNNAIHVSVRGQPVDKIHKSLAVAKLLCPDMRVAHIQSFHEAALSSTRILAVMVLPSSLNSKWMPGSA
jgi:hypothetical protein